MKTSIPMVLLLLALILGSGAAESADTDRERAANGSVTPKVRKVGFARGVSSVAWNSSLEDFLLNHPGFETVKFEEWMKAFVGADCQIFARTDSEATPKWHFVFAPDDKFVAAYAAWSPADIPKVSGKKFAEYILNDVVLGEEQHIILSSERGKETVVVENNNMDVSTKASQGNVYTMLWIVHATPTDGTLRKSDEIELFRFRDRLYGF